MRLTVALPPKGPGLLRLNTLPQQIRGVRTYLRGYAQGNPTVASLPIDPTCAAKVAGVLQTTVPRES